MEIPWVLEGVILFIIHSFLFNILFYLQLFGSEWKSREPSTSEKKTLSAWRFECFHAAWPLRKRNRKICKSHVMYKNKKWGEAL